MMSAHWNPRPQGGRKTRGSPLVRIPGVRRGDLQTMLVAGLALGLAASFGAEPGVGGPVADRVAAVAGGVRVIDGDTFDYGGERIRIADIDTPELRGRCAYEIALAGQATERMRALLAGPFELHRTPDGRDEDGYGRKLRIVTRNGRSLGDALVAEGLARTWSGRREPWCT